MLLSPLPEIDWIYETVGRIGHSGGAMEERRRYGEVKRSQMSDPSLALAGRTIGQTLLPPLSDIKDIYETGRNV